jgi:hypothetical protein
MFCYSLRFSNKACVEIENAAQFCRLDKCSLRDLTLQVCFFYTKLAAFQLVKKKIITVVPCDPLCGTGVYTHAGTCQPDGRCLCAYGWTGPHAQYTAGNRILVGVPLYSNAGNAVSETQY